MIEDESARTHWLHCACVPFLRRGPPRSGGMPPLMQIQFFADAWQPTIFDVRSWTIIRPTPNLICMFSTQRRHATASRPPSLPSSFMSEHENPTVVIILQYHTFFIQHHIHHTMRKCTYCTHPPRQERMHHAYQCIMGSHHTTTSLSIAIITHPILPFAHISHHRWLVYNIMTFYFHTYLNNEWDA